MIGVFLSIIWNFVSNWIKINSIENTKCLFSLWCNLPFRIYMSVGFKALVKSISLVLFNLMNNVSVQASRRSAPPCFGWRGFGKLLHPFQLSAEVKIIKVFDSFVNDSGWPSWPLASSFGPSVIRGSTWSSSPTKGLEAYLLMDLKWYWAVWHGLNVKSQTNKMEYLKLFSDV